MLLCRHWLLQRADTNHGVGYKSRQRLQITVIPLQITATATNHGKAVTNHGSDRHKITAKMAIVSSSRLSSRLVFAFGAGSLRFGGRDTNHGIPRQITPAVTPNHGIDFGRFASIFFVWASFFWCFARPLLFALPSLLFTLPSLLFALPSLVPSPLSPPVFLPVSPLPLKSSLPSCVRCVPGPMFTRRTACTH